jgi:hypothetical protein
MQKVIKVKTKVPEGKKREAIQYRRGKNIPSPSVLAVKLNGGCLPAAMAARRRVPPWSSTQRRHTETFSAVKADQSGPSIICDSTEKRKVSCVELFCGIICFNRTLNGSGKDCRPIGVET